MRTPRAIDRLGGIGFKLTPRGSCLEQSIAAANHISLRHLYRLWSHNELDLAEWIIVERLARAAGALASERQQRRPISAIAYSLGSKDAAHFSRRFRPLTGFLPTSGGERRNTNAQAMHAIRALSAA